MNGLSDTHVVPVYAVPSEEEGAAQQTIFHELIQTAKFITLIL